MRALEILHSEGSDSIVLADTVTHDDIAEVFHNERHTVNQTVEQALATAQLFAAAPALLSSATKLIAAFDELQNTTVAERILTGRSDRHIREASNEAIAELRAAIAKATVS